MYHSRLSGILFSIILLSPLGASGQEPAKIEPVTITAEGHAGNDGSIQAALSANGKIIAFSTYASDLVTNADEDTNADVYVRNVSEQTTQLGSVLPEGLEEHHNIYPELSNDGKLLKFERGYSNTPRNGLLRDLEAGTTSVFCNGCGKSSLSGSGKFIAYESAQSNLVENDTNSRTDIFLFDVQRQRITRASVTDQGEEGNGNSLNPSLGESAALLAFESSSTNFNSVLSSGNTNIFLKDFITEEITLVSRGHDGSEANGNSSDAFLSDNEKFLVFISEASNLVEDDTNTHADIFLYDIESGKIEMISRALLGEAANGPSRNPSLSADGRYITFESVASNLVEHDVNDLGDAFIYDRIKKTLRAIYPGSALGTFRPSISADGSTLAFKTADSDLIESDSNAESDIFIIANNDNLDFCPDDATKLLPGACGCGEEDTDDNLDGIYDCQLKCDQYTVERISVSSSGEEANDRSGSIEQLDINEDGRYVVFASNASNLVENDTNEESDIFLRDTVEKTTVRISVSSSGEEANGRSGFPSITPDGRYITYYSKASNLVEDDTNRNTDAFRYDRITGKTLRVNTYPDGTEISRGANRFMTWIKIPLSDDGRFVAFQSEDSNLVPDDLPQSYLPHLYLKDLETGELTFIDDAGTNLSGEVVTMTGDGKTLVYTAYQDSLRFEDAFATIILYDVETKAKRVIADGSFLVRHPPEISKDGSVVVYTMSTRNGFLLYRYDVRTKQTVLLSANEKGDFANGHTRYSSISADGRFIAFSSEATDIIDSDINQLQDVFLYDHETGTKKIFSRPSGCRFANGDSYMPALSEDGKYVVFTSEATNLIGDDWNGKPDIYMIKTDIAQDFCPLDDFKTEQGICGCGFGDEDNDQDGALNCQEECIFDPAKDFAGECGCGIPDADLNQNGVLDCFETPVDGGPEVDAIPDAPVVTRRRRKILLQLQEKENALYEIIIKRRPLKKRKKARTTSRVIDKSSYSFRSNRSGRYVVQYRWIREGVDGPSPVSEFSKKVRFRVDKNK